MVSPVARTRISTSPSASERPTIQAEGHAHELVVLELHAGTHLAAIVDENIQAGRVELLAKRLRGLKDFVTLAGSQDMHVKGGDLRGPAQTLVIAVGLGQGCHDAGNADAVRTHGDDLGLAVLVEDSQTESLGVLTAQLEDMTDLDAALEVKRARAVGSQVALAHLGGLDRTVSGEVAAHHEIQDVTLLGRFAPVTQAVPSTTRGSTR